MILVLVALARTGRPRAVEPLGHGRTAGHALDGVGHERNGLLLTSRRSWFLKEMFLFGVCQESVFGLYMFVSFPFSRPWLNILIMLCDVVLGTFRSVDYQLYIEQGGARKKPQGTSRDVVRRFRLTVE